MTVKINHNFETTVYGELVHEKTTFEIHKDEKFLWLEVQGVQEDIQIELNEEDLLALLDAMGSDKVKEPEE
jgi:hypothetical protein